MKNLKISKTQTLVITGLNLDTNKEQNFLLTASNPFMLVLKYMEVQKNTFILNWALTNAKGESGNAGINAGAYLLETMEELSGLNLS